METTQIRLARRPVGAPDAGTFATVTETLPEVGDGEVLLAVRYLSLDPYMRGRLSDAPSYADPVAVGDVIVGGTVARCSSRGTTGWPWVTRCSRTPAGRPTRWSAARLSASSTPTSHRRRPRSGCSACPASPRTPGCCRSGKPQPGETVVVAAATGPVGSAVGQIAKLKGARAVGIAGGPDKVRALTEEFGFDVGVDHRAEDFRDQLAAAVPDGIDVYFENVGGAVFDAVRRHLNLYARIPVCGLVANYNATEAPSGPDRMPGLFGQVLTKSLTIRGFIMGEFVAAHYRDFLREMGGWVRDGDVRYREDVVEGLKNALRRLPACSAAQTSGSCWSGCPEPHPVAVVQ